MTGFCVKIDEGLWVSNRKTVYGLRKVKYDHIKISSIKLVQDIESFQSILLQGIHTKSWTPKSRQLKIPIGKSLDNPKSQQPKKSTSLNPDNIQFRCFNSISLIWVFTGILSCKHYGNRDLIKTPVYKFLKNYNSCCSNHQQNSNTNFNSWKLFPIPHRHTSRTTSIDNIFGWKNIQATYFICPLIRTIFPIFIFLLFIYAFSLWINLNENSVFICTENVLK